MVRPISILIIFYLTFVQTFCFAQTKQKTKTTKTVIIETPEFTGAPGEIPEFPGGKDSMTVFFNKNIHGPFNILNGKGIVGVEFNVDSTGTIKDVKLIKSLCNECDKEVLRVVKLMPKWQPRIDPKSKRPEETKVSLPIMIHSKE